MLARRGLLAGLLFAPAIIRTPGLLMPVKPLVLPRAAFNGLMTPEMIGREMLAIMGSMMMGGALKTHFDEVSGQVATTLIPDIRREFYG